MSGVGVGEIVISLAVALLVITRQVRARPLTVRSMLVLPVIMGVIGVVELVDVGHLNSTDVRWVLVDLAVAVASGLLRAPSVHLYARDGVLWRQGDRWTVGLWVLSIAARVAVAIVGGNDGAGSALSHGLLLSFAVSLASQYIVIALRAARSDVPFAPAQPMRQGRSSAA